jgi:hypothetical protein
MERLYADRLLPGMRIDKATRFIRGALQAAVVLPGWFKGVAETPS